MIRLSVVCPARTEFPNIVHTFYSVMHCWIADGFDPKELEFIIVDNASEDNRNDPQRGVKGTTTYLMPRGAFYNRFIRVLYDPICGNHSARNKGVDIARGEYVFLTDAHMAYSPGTFKHLMETVDKHGGIVHTSVNWMGAWPATSSTSGVQYTIALGEEGIRGTWNNNLLVDKPFYIPALGHCSLMFKRNEFQYFRYPLIHRTYGSGEIFVNMSAWMNGFSVMVDPRAHGFHLSSSRGYSYNHNDYVENSLGMLYAIGADAIRERAYIHRLRKASPEFMDKMMTRVEKEYLPDRQRIEKLRKKTIEQVLVEKPWDKMNDKLHGKHNSSMKIFHWSSLELIAQEKNAKEAYLNSKHQQQLGEWFETELGSYIFKHKEYEKKYGMEALTRLRKECRL